MSTFLASTNANEVQIHDKTQHCLTCGGGIVKKEDFITSQLTSVNNNISEIIIDLFDVIEVSC